MQPANQPMKDSAGTFTYTLHNMCCLSVMAAILGHITPHLNIVATQPTTGWKVNNDTWQRQYRDSHPSATAPYGTPVVDSHHKRTYNGGAVSTWTEPRHRFEYNPQQKDELVNLKRREIVQRSILELGQGAVSYRLPKSLTTMVKSDNNDTSMWANRSDIATVSFRITAARISPPILLGAVYPGLTRVPRRPKSTRTSESTKTRSTKTLQLSGIPEPSGVSELTRTQRSTKISESTRIRKSKWALDSRRTPPNKAKTPGDSTTQPSHSMRTPAHSTRTPAHSSRTPSHSTRTPADSIIQPSHSTRTPSHSTRTPADSTKTPPHSPRTPDLQNRAASDTTMTSDAEEKDDEEGEPWPYEDLHLRLTAEETTDCFIQTSMAEIKTNRKRYPKFVGRTPIKATRVYRELFATKGSVIVGGNGYDTDLQASIQNGSLPSCNVFSDRSYKEHCCALRVRVPAGMYAVVEIPQILGSVVCVYDTSSSGRKRIVSFSANPFEETASGNNTLVFTSASNVAHVVLIAREKRPRGGKRASLRSLQLAGGMLVPERHFRFRALGKAGLQVKRTGPSGGFIETYLHNEHTILIAPLLDPWAFVQAPAGRVVMVSFPSSVMLWNCLALYAADAGNQTLMDVCFGESPLPRPAVHNTSLLLVRFWRIHHSYMALAFRGASLRFSVHDMSLLSAGIQGAGEGSSHRWNCSVDIPGRLDLLQHLSCNLEVECRDVEDESDCSYSSALCGPGYLTLGGACFFYVRTQEELAGLKLSWEEALDVCEVRGREIERERRGSTEIEGGGGGGRGGGGGSRVRLASLNSVAKWKEAADLLPVHRHKYLPVFVGLRSAPAGLPLWYSGSYQWSDATTAFYMESERAKQTKRRERQCGFMIIQHNILNMVWIKRTAHLCTHTDCGKKITANVLCEKPASLLDESAEEDAVTINGTSRWPHDPRYVRCPAGHFTHLSLSCDVTTSCWSRDHSSPCAAASSSLLTPFFTCASGLQRVPYTLVCDNRAHCDDDSDEDFCRMSPCRRLEPFSCNKQCIPVTKVCDGWEDCHNGEDEHQCEAVVTGRGFIPPPALVTLTTGGRLLLRRLRQESGVPSAGPQGITPSTCPDTHFQCLDNGYCLPVILRCNSVYDCPGREDEAGCDTCPGYYRCRASQVCLQHSDLCDGRAHCPQHDDELLCQAHCPLPCVCRGLAFFCRRSFAASAFPLVRFLDASTTSMSPASLNENALLIHLALANCGLARLHGFYLPNLLSLDVRDNRLSTLSHVHMAGAPQLRELSVAGNPLALVFEGAEGLRIFRRLLKLDLSRVLLLDLNVSTLSAFPNLQVLNLSHSQVQRVHGEGFLSVERLRVIDLRGCPMTWFPRGMFRGLVQLERVHAHSFKMCCPALLPLDFSLRNCFAPSDEISSCDDLLRGSGYLVCVFVLSLLAVVGNAVSFIFRSYVSNRETKLGYGIFVTHLSVSDFLMGVYLAVIGGANQVYHGTYLWNDVAWRHSSVCKLAGFLSLLSSEVSALIMCLITLDRFLVIRFPFSRLHFRPRSAHTASAVVWVCGAFLASVPLLPVTSHWEFYSQTGICIPLPVTRSYFAGYDYSFSIVIVFNFVLFVFISVGQLCIYWSVRANAMSVSNTTKKTKDLTIARRLITVAMSDFLCWFPIGVLGLLASDDVPIPGEVNVAVAIFVLPLNAAVNPCLYSFNVIAERRSRAQEEKLRALLLAQLKARS